MRYFKRSSGKGAPSTHGMQYFASHHVCRYIVEFPMDAGQNDNVYLNIKYLRNIKMTVGIGYNYKSKDLNG